MKKRVVCDYKICQVELIHLFKYYFLVETSQSITLNLFVYECKILITFDFAASAILPFY